MKTTYSQFLLNLIVCFSLFTLSNCNDDCGPTPKVLIRDLGKYVPYTGNDTLRFLHNNTDTQTFVGQGLERFYVSSRRQQDTKCSEEDHESIRIRFVNPQTQDEIKMEYSYDIKFSDIFSLNAKTYYKFYPFHKNYGEFITIKYDTNAIEINNMKYSKQGLILFGLSQDTTEYIYYRIPIDNNPSGIIKIKSFADTFLIISN